MDDLANAGVPKEGVSPRVAALFRTLHIWLLMANPGMSSPKGDVSNYVGFTMTIKHTESLSNSVVVHFNVVYCDDSKEKFGFILWGPFDFYHAFGHLDWLSKTKGQRHVTVV